MTATFSARWEALTDTVFQPTGSAWWVATAESILREARDAAEEIMAAEGTPVTDWYGDAEVGYDYDETGSDHPDHPAHERYAEVACAVFEALRAADAGDAIVLEVALCADRRSIRVSFASEDLALTYIDAHTGRAYSDWSPDYPTIDAERHPRLWDRLNPTCDHGMSAWLCEGPGHYGYGW